MINEKTKLLALAHLKTGKKPKEVAELMAMPYAAVVKLNKELALAEQQGTVEQLFKLDKVTMESLFEQVRSELEQPLQTLTGDVIPLNEQLEELSASVQELGNLEAELAMAARELVKQIKTASMLAAAAPLNSDTLLTLTEALTKIQLAFFAKGTNIQVNNINGGFERYLSD